MNNTNNKINKIHFVIFSLCFIYIILFAAFYLVCFFDREGLYKLIVANKTYENLPFTLDLSDIKLISTELMQYISGKLPFLETKVTISGVLTEFYSVRSKIHMADVRNIIVTLEKVEYLALLFAVISAFKMIRYDNFLSVLNKIYIRTMIVIAIIISIIFAYASINFSAFFVKFHQVLFTNDLWLLDPDVDYIICLLPEKIFMTYGFRIIISMVIAIITSVFVLHILSKIQSHQEAI